MNVVLFHLGTSRDRRIHRIPMHIKYCITQILHSNPELEKIYFLTNLNIGPPEGDSRVSIIDTNQFAVPNVEKYFEDEEDVMNKILFQTSLYRLFYLEKFIKQYNIENVIHFDNDVLLYSNLQKYEDKFKQFNFLITSHFEQEYVFGFSYVKNYKALTIINQELARLANVPRKKLEALIDHHCPHQMRLLAYINKKYDNKLIDLLPTTPTGEGSDNFELFNACFDPSTYGKHVGGSHEFTPGNKHFVETSKWKGTESHHNIGKQLIANNIQVDFRNTFSNQLFPTPNDPVGRRSEPYIKFNNKEYDIVNLHIHTKKLEKFTSI
tara:strand:+ start:7713 stop:8681 length:969 start_codon:yes stop_codon:yes gene_type:complete